MECSFSFLLDAINFIDSISIDFKDKFIDDIVNTKETHIHSHIFLEVLNKKQIIY